MNLREAITGINASAEQIFLTKGKPEIQIHNERGKKRRRAKKGEEYVTKRGVRSGEKGRKRQANFVVSQVALLGTKSSKWRKVRGKLRKLAPQKKVR